MLRKIKFNSLKKHTDRSLEQRDVSQRNAKLIHLGFLTDESFYGDIEALYNLGIELGLRRENIKVFAFSKSNGGIPSLRQDQITNKEFNWRGEMVSQNAKEFLDFPFDVLIGIYNNKHEFLEAMIAQSKAKFKVGFSNSDQRFYDLLLKIDPKNNELFRSELKKYLKVFNKI